jgi:phospholipid/cholesterol/gamma-HCH transport system substrate-binding protein
MIYEETLYNSALTTVSNLQNASASAQDMIADITAVVTNASSGKGTLGKLMTDDSLFFATRDAMTNLDDVLIKINNGQGTVGELINNKDFYKNAKLSLQKLDKAADGLEDQGPLSVIGILAGPLGL